MLRILLGAFVLLLSLSGPVLAQTREVGTLVYDGIPEIPGSLLETLARYQNSRSASFQGWTAGNGILIRTRFGDSAQIHRVRAPGAMREQITFFDEPARNATSSPSGDRFIVARDTSGREHYQGHLIDRSGRAIVITDPGTRNDAFTFSADGSQIAWTRATPGQANWDIILMEGENLQSRRVVATGLGTIAPLDFSPDGRQLLLHRYISATASERYVLDIATGVLRKINPVDREISYVGGHFSADGRSILVLSDQDSEFARLVRLDLASGRMDLLSPPDLRWDVEGYDLTKLSSFDVSHDGNLLAYSINEDGRSRLVLIDLRSGRNLPSPELGNSILSKVRFSPDGTMVAMTRSSADAESDVWTWNHATRALTRWTHSEMGGLQAEQLPRTELIRFSSFDGQSIPAFVYSARPPPAGRRPVLILVHGGPAAQMRPGYDATIAYFVDQLGAVVIAPNIRGSTGYGRSFTDMDNGDRREDSVRDIGALLDWVARQPNLDPSRVVVYGASYGGYVALATLALFGDRVAGVIDEVGISNWSSFLENTEGYRRDSRRAEYGDERDPQTRALFDRISPLNMTDRMTKPLLVIHGANDPRVPRSEAEQIVSRLRAQGRDVWYLLARDEGHGFRRKANQDASIAVQAAFLRRAFRLDR